MPSGLKEGPLVAAAHALRIQGMRRIDAALTEIDVEDLRGFVDALGALLVLDVNAACIGRKAGIATATVTRWSQGFHSPHRLMIPKIVEAMRAVISDEIQKASAFARAGLLKVA